MSGMLPFAPARQRRRELIDSWKLDRPSPTTVNLGFGANAYPNNRPIPKHYRALLLETSMRTTVTTENYCYLRFNLIATGYHSVYMRSYVGGRNRAGSSAGALRYFVHVAPSNSLDGGYSHSQIWIPDYARNDRYKVALARNTSIGVSGASGEVQGWEQAGVMKDTAPIESMYWFGDVSTATLSMVAGSWAKLWGILY